MVEYFIYYCLVHHLVPFNLYILISQLACLHDQN